MSIRLQNRDGQIVRVWFWRGLANEAMVDVHDLRARPALDPAQRRQRIRRHAQKARDRRLQVLEDILTINRSQRRSPSLRSVDGDAA